MLSSNLSTFKNVYREVSDLHCGQISVYHTGKGSAINTCGFSTEHWLSVTHSDVKLTQRIKHPDQLQWCSNDWRTTVSHSLSRQVCFFSVFCPGLLSALVVLPHTHISPVCSYFWFWSFTPATTLCFFKSHSLQPPVCPAVSSLPLNTHTCKLNTTRNVAKATTNCPTTPETENKNNADVTNLKTD